MEPRFVEMPRNLGVAGIQKANALILQGFLPEPHERLY